MRSMTQFIRKCGKNEVIKNIADILGEATNATSVKRLAYETFVLKATKEEQNKKDLEKTTTQLTNNLKDYFRHEKTAGPCYLVLQAIQHWNQKETSEDVLNTPLFQPLQHPSEDYSAFIKNASLNHWTSIIKKLPHNNEISKSIEKIHTILPYPQPEAGTKAPERSLNLDNAQNTTKKNTILIEALTSQETSIT